VAIDSTVRVTRLSADVELDHRVGDLISDGADGEWRVEEIALEERRLVVSEVMLTERYVAVAPELLAA
jgi:hypothetical protein